MEESKALSLVKSDRAKCPTPQIVDDEAFFINVLNFLQHRQIPTGESLESWSRQTSSYRVIDGVLHKGARNPKQVVIQAREKEEILVHFHVDKSTGLHKSAQDTANAIKDHFFWRTILPDSRSHVSKCDTCQDSNKEGSHCWSHLELAVHGPFPTSHGDLKNVVTLLDLTSGWIVASMASSVTEELVSCVSSLLFSSMCQYGFAQTSLVSFHDAVFQNVCQEFQRHCKSLLDECPQWCTTSFEQLLKLTDSPSDQSRETTESITAFVASHFDTWERLLDVWLFQRRTVPGRPMTPFWSMFRREPIVAGAKTQIAPYGGGSQKRRRLQNAMLHCRHCNQPFTSRVSFRIHQQRHLDEARREGAVNGEQEQPPLQVDDEAAGETGIVMQEIEDDCHIPETEVTIGAVKSLMTETKDERCKRGKYFKYSTELREQIAQYAQEHGSLEASHHFSRLLGNPLSESTIRNFVKAAHMFSQSLKDEIGKHAYQFGIEASLKLYQSKMPKGVDLRRPMIRRLKEMFLMKNPNLPLEEDDDEQDQDVSSAASRQKFVFEASLKDDIGRYAFHCGNTNAVHHFSTKLRFPMKESTVRSFKKSWMEKNGVEVMDPTTTRPDTTTKESLYDFERGLEESQSVPLPLTVGRNEDSLTGVNATPLKLKRRTAGKKLEAAKKGEQQRSKRGRYAMYDPSLRAEIANFARDHGNQETINHFRAKLNIEVPESTVRGLRDRLLAKSGSKKVTQLSQGRRGRPMRLGKYDGLVQKCIRQLVESGEKPTSFLAVATAKQVLMENDPQLLAENGGAVELNTTWAKSFLRRMNLGK